MEHVEAKDPEQAAALAVWVTVQNVGEDENLDLLEIVEVVEGYHMGKLGSDTTLSTADIKYKPSSASVRHWIRK